MNARAGSGWQTVLADLSLILFMVMAAAVDPAQPDGKPDPAPTTALLPALGEPVAVWTAGPGAPPLALWLAQAGRDPQLRLTIRAPLSEAETALALAGQAGRPARIVLESDLAGPVLATLTYDQGRELAQGLQLKEANP